MARIRGDALQSARTGNGHGEEIAIRAERFVLISIRCETKLLAVGRERNRFRAAKVERRHVVVGAGSQVTRSSSAGGNDEKMTSFSVRPGGPMAVQKFFVNTGLHFAFLFFGVAPRVTGVISAIGIDGGNERNCFTVG